MGRPLADAGAVAVINGDLADALHTLKRQIIKAGIPRALRRHAFAESPGERRRRKQRLARQRARLRAQRRA